MTDLGDGTIECDLQWAGGCEETVPEASYHQKGWAVDGDDRDACPPCQEYDPEGDELPDDPPYPPDDPWD